MAKERFTEDMLKAKGFMQDVDGNYTNKLQKAITQTPKVEKKEVPNSNYRGKRDNKYGRSSAADRTYNGKVYDSKLEMQYRQHLDLLQKAGVITRIIEQIQYAVDINQIHICNYILDFIVWYKAGHIEYIDCKGMKTPTYKLKKKLVEAYYPNLKIKEVKTGDF